MERKIGEIFACNGKLYQVVKGFSCNGCFFDQGENIPCTYNYKCNRCTRSDKKNVIFKEVNE